MNEQKNQAIFALLRAHVAECEACATSQTHLVNIRKRRDAECISSTQREKNTRLTTMLIEHRDVCSTCLLSQAHVGELLQKHGVRCEGKSHK